MSCIIIFTILSDVYKRQRLDGTDNLSKEFICYVRNNNTDALRFIGSEPFGIKIYFVAVLINNIHNFSFGIVRQLNEVLFMSFSQI